jgi:hypothetical protein
MAYTVNDLIKDILMEVGAVDASEPADAADTNLVLRRLNLYLGQIGATNLMARANVPESFPLVAGTASYTIGLTGTFATLKPYRIVDAFIRDTSSDDTPLSIIGENEYSAYEDKIVTLARPEALYYDPGATQQVNHVGTITLYPPPDASMAYTLFIYSEKALAEITSLVANITFEPPYYEMLLYNVARRVWRSFHDDGTPCNKDIIMMAAHATAVIETMNAKDVVARTDVPGNKAGSYNIYRDDYNS